MFKEIKEPFLSSRDQNVRLFIFCGGIRLVFDRCVEYSIVVFRREDIGVNGEVIKVNQGDVKKCHVCF